MIEHGRAVTRRMLVVQDGSPLGGANQFEEPPLALDQRQVAQVVAVMLDQAKGNSTASLPSLLCSKASKELGA